MSVLVLVTRPAAQAVAFASELSSIGVTPVVHPMLDVEYLDVDLSKVPRPDAILLTSLQGAAKVSLPDAWCKIPFYCVGDKTEEFARRAGAKNCIVGAGDVAHLLPVIRQTLKPKQRILYLCGEHVTQDMGQALSDYVVDARTTYCAHVIEKFSPDVEAIFSQISFITLFSPRTGESLRGVMEKNGLISAAKNINLLCLSSSVLESVKDIEWKACYIPDKPTQASMTKKLKSLIQE